nr:hypothetical protein GCM10020063_010320 [Dactylosporangium thailandense]
MDALKADEFWRQGVVVVPEVLAGPDLDLVREQVDGYLSDPQAPTTEVSGRYAGAGRYAYGHDMLRYVDAMWAALQTSALVPEIIRMLGSDGPLTLLDDQIYVKEPGTAEPTPWHQDGSYWAVSGRQLCTAWLALDPVRPDNGGLQFVLGSHRWGTVFRAQAFAPGQQVEDPGHRPVPDDDVLRAEHTVWSPELAPGDAVVFHASTLHGAGPNRSAVRRRAVVSRWAGTDVRYAPRSRASRRQMDKAERNGVAGGAPFTGPDYAKFGRKENPA